MMTSKTNKKFSLFNIQELLTLNLISSIEQFFFIIFGIKSINKMLK